MSKLKQKALTLTRPAFQAWLESKHPRSYIGVTGEGDACPLARYLKSTTGETDVLVDGGSVADVGESTVKMPKWAQNFVERVDLSGEYRVTARRALKILKASRSDGYLPYSLY